MKKIILICCCLLFVLNSQAKEHVYGTKQNGNFIFNDVTQRVTFKGKVYTYLKSEETREGFNMFCSIDNQFIMFEVYSTQCTSYIIQYGNGNDINSKTKPSLYHEGLGKILAEDIASNIVNYSDSYLYEASITDANEKTNVMSRVSDAMRLINKGGVRVSVSGSYSFDDPEFAHLKSDGEFKKSWGRTKKDDNYYNNLAFYIIGQAVKDAGSRSSLSEGDMKLIASTLTSTSINWLQVIKDEIIAYDVQ